MDPLSIAGAAAGIVKSCCMVTATIYTIVDETRNIDSTVDDLLREIQGLSRGAEAIATTWTQNPKITTAKTASDGNLWCSVEASLEDCQLTLAKLNSKLDDIKRGGVFGLKFMRKPTKLVILNMKMRDITAFKDQIQSYNNAMQSALLMINVCLMLNSNSSQESMSQVLVGLKTQIGRVETTLHHQRHSGITVPELATDSDRMTRNLRALIREAESLHSSASTVVGDARSTVWGGSVLGDPLSNEQYSSIRNWIPPPAIEEVSIDDKEVSSSTLHDSTLRAERTSDPASDTDSDIDTHLLKRYREIALSSLEEKDYPRAESFYRKVTEMSADAGDSPDEIQDLKIMLAISCGLQGKWDELETTFPPIAFAKRISDIRPFHGLYALSMVNFNFKDFETATKYCKRAIGGYRRLLGKSHSRYFEAMHVLALIYDATGDHISAEGCRTFLPAEHLTPDVFNPETSLEIIMSNVPNTKVTQTGLRPTTPLPSPGEQSGEPSIQSQLDFARASSKDFQLPSESFDSSIRDLSQRLSGQSLDPNSSSAFQSRAANKEDSRNDQLASPLQVTDGKQPSTQEYSVPLTRTGPASQPKKTTRFIIAIHFGVSDTSVAWDLVGEAEGILDMSLGNSDHSRQKIPTVLYYDLTQKLVGWGLDVADALAPAGNVKSGVVKVDLFKLHLMLGENSYVNTTDLPELPPGKSEIDVAADYLSKIRIAMNLQLQKLHGEVFLREEGSIQYYFTMPGVCNGTGEKLLRAAIVQAGYLRDANDQRLSLVTEAEAALHYYLMTEVVGWQIKGGVLIVGCGTVTTDLQAFQLPGTSPDLFSEFTPPSGATCGSNAVNGNFLNILQSKIRKMRVPDHSKTVMKVYSKCVTDFRNRIQNSFSNDGQKWAIDVDLMASYHKADIEDGYMLFTNDEILECFEPVVSQILNLIEGQATLLQMRGLTLEKIVVTGPFSQSRYLFEQIKLRFQPASQSNVARPRDVDRVFVRGALIVGRDIRRSPGVKTSRVPYAGNIR